MTLTTTRKLSPTRTGYKNSKFWEYQRAPSPGNLVPIIVEINEAPYMPWATGFFKGVVDAYFVSICNLLSSPVSLTN